MPSPELSLYKNYIKCDSCSNKSIDNYPEEMYQMVLVGDPGNKTIPEENGVHTPMQL